ncbi:MAG TPA: hypothetical protein VIS96_06065 [Terrimicrobiaceae bacterium]
MQPDALLDYLPLWALYVATVAIVLLSIEGGFRLGRRRIRRTEPEKESSVGEMVGASLGLLALLLAFTFGLAASRFEARRQVFLDEVNAIGTAYLRAALLPETDRTDARKLLREYVDVRLGGVRSGKVKEAIRRSEDLQASLWAKAVALGQKSPTSIVIGLFIQSLNELIDLHTKRVTTGLRSRIPNVIWLVLYAITVLAMAEMGYHSGLAGKRRPLSIPAVALAFPAVMLLIADLDRPGEGVIRVNQQAMDELRKTMDTSEP